MWNKQRYCRRSQNHVWIAEFPQEELKNYHALGKYSYLFVVLRYGGSCQEMCGTILWVGKQDDSTTLQSINSMHRWPPLQRRRIEIRGRSAKSMLSNCSKMLETWHVLDDLIFYGQWTNLHDRWQNGPRLVTNDCLVWYLALIIHVNSNSIVMWETLPNNADWDCFKTPILQEILRIQNLHQVEHCTFSEAIRLCQPVGCVRNKLQFRTVHQNQKSFPWMQD